MVKGIFWYGAAAVIVLDQLSKAVVEATRPGMGLLHYRQNTGAAFGILQGHTFWLAMLSLIVAVVVVFHYRTIPEKNLPQLLWGLFLGGVIGNLIDRAFRGYVVDFIDVGFWPAFNLADSALTLSVIGLMIYYWKR